MRFTLPKLFLAVALAALACAGMFSPTFGLTSSVVTVTLGLFIFTLVRALYLQGRDRVFSVTFAVAGLVYLLFITNGLTEKLSRAFATNYPLALFAIAREKASLAPPMASPTYYVPTTTYGPIPPIAPTLPNTTVGFTSTPVTVDASLPTPSVTYTEPASPTLSTSPPQATTPSTVVPATGTTTWTTLPVVPYEPSVETVISRAYITYDGSFPDGTSPTYRIFLIGHCVWSWLFGLFAAWFAGRMYAKRHITTQPLVT